MSEVRLLLRVCILLCAALVIGSCRSADDRTMLTGPCSSMLGDANRRAPIVCVDDGPRTPVVSHKVIEAHDVNGIGGPPVEIQWITKSGTGPLRIDVETPGCLTPVRCDGNGTCTAKTLPTSARKTCKYSVFIDDGKHEELDPDVVIVPCC